MAWRITSDYIFKCRSGKLLKLLGDFLYCQKQRVVLNGKHSSWENFNAEVPQSSNLGPLLFLIYINDLSNGVSSTCKHFACDNLFFQGLKTSSQVQLRYAIAFLFNEKWFLILIWLSKLKRWYSAEKLWNCFCLVFHLITFFKE